MITGVNPYLGFDGNCAEAFLFYEKALGGQIIAMFKNSEAPEGMPIAPGAENNVMHVNLKVGNFNIMGGDAPPGPFDGHRGYSVSLNFDDNETAENVFAALAQGGQIFMPIGETFWAYRFGMLMDKFGVPWMINHQKPMA